jgi:hypothetical protein
MPRHNFSTSFPLCHWSIFFCFHPLLDAEKICLNLHVLIGLIFQDHSNSTVSCGNLFISIYLFIMIPGEY